MDISLSSPFDAQKFSVLLWIRQVKFRNNMSTKCVWVWMWVPAHVCAVDKVCISKYPKMAGDYIDCKDWWSVWWTIYCCEKNYPTTFSGVEQQSSLISRLLRVRDSDRTRQIIFALPCWGSQLEDLKKTTGRVGDSRGLAEHKVSYSLGEQVGPSCWQKSSAPPRMALPEAAWESRHQVSFSEIFTGHQGDKT